MKRDIYEDVITRRRWKLVEAVWLLHGVFIKIDKAYTAALELFYGGEVEQHRDDQEQEVLRSMWADMHRVRMSGADHGEGEGGEMVRRD